MQTSWSSCKACFGYCHRSECRQVKNPLTFFNIASRMTADFLIQNLSVSCDLEKLCRPKQEILLAGDLGALFWWNHRDLIVPTLWKVLNLLLPEWILVNWRIVPATALFYNYGTSMHTVFVAKHSLFFSYYYLWLS